MTALDRRWTRTGCVAGSLGLAMYLSRSFLPLPDPVATACFCLFGPALVVAFLGLDPLMQQGPAKVAARIGVVFGIIGGAVNMAFAVVQLNTLYFMRRAIAAATDPATKDTLRRILSGVFTVQNGLNITMDFFIDAAAFAWALAMWHHPRFGRRYATLSVLLVGPHFAMKAYAFPVPPAESGLFDAGPLVGVWFLLVTVRVAMILRQERFEGTAA